jgi:hypothetical protein
MQEFYFYPTFRTSLNNSSQFCIFGMDACTKVKT